MKTQKTNSMKKMAVLIVVGLTLNFTACSNKQSESKSDESKISTEGTEASKKIDLHTAALMGNVEAIKQHIDAGTDLNTKDPKSGSTALITAAVFGKLDVAKALIEAGADINIKNNDGATALHSAAFFCHPHIVKVLLANGADKTTKNNFGSTAFESVAGSFNDLKPIYTQLGKQLAPLGLQLDLNHVEATRPVIAEMLQ
ncbi:MAG: ankyrin repeat domain-containing protein [Salinivirgaceae bacterium]|jgi:ankyrin repeat protein|nr:ankyrin repeat domain-containing protein [Salinivirgaceae bacterium]